MAKEVILTPLAKANIHQIVDYLISDWTISIAEHFVFRLEKIFALISETPQIYPVVNKAKGIQRALVTRHNILYFIETATHIKVVTIFDTRQTPKKLNKIF